MGMQDDRQYIHDGVLYISAFGRLIVSRSEGTVSPLSNVSLRLGDIPVLPQMPSGKATPTSAALTSAWPPFVYIQSPINQSMT